MRILVTNDDGIDSLGLHYLARAMTPLGDVVVAAPDGDQSGAGAAISAIYRNKPQVKKAHIDGVPESWAVAGPPGLCAFMGRLGAFGEPFDLVVSGINPGANVGRSVYHSGTIGACLTARNGGLSGVAVSQAVSGWGVEGQAWDDIVLNQIWETPATVAQHFVKGLLDDGLPEEPIIANINVPNLELADLKGWKRTTIDYRTIRSMSTASLKPIGGTGGTYEVEFTYGDAIALPDHTDGGAVEAGYVSVSYLSRITDVDRDDAPCAEGALNSLLDR